MEALEVQLGLFEKAGVIVEVHESSGWNVPIHMVSEGLDAEGNKKVRMTMDFSEINKVFQDSSASMPRISHLIQNTKDCVCLGKLDFQKFFFQLELHQESRKYTTFEAPNGKRYQFTRLPMGLSKSPEFAQACTSKFFPDRGYMDDVLLKGQDFEEFIEDVKRSFQICRDNNLKVSAEKTFLNFEELEYIGYSTNAKGFRLQDSLKLDVGVWDPPPTIQAMQSFLGLINYTRNFINGYAELVKPLYEMIPKEGKPTTKLNWSEDLEKVFIIVKEAVANCSELHHLDFSKEIFVNTDASNRGWGAILWQGIESDKKVIAYLSGSYNSVQQRWPTVEQECFAIFKALTSWRHKLLGQKFTVFTDHRNLCFILTSETKKLTRWRLALQEFEFKVIHVAGKSNWEADLLSRQLISE